MIARIVNFSVARRWHVLIATILLSILGAFALTRLPIDAVPDITNTQVQINVVAPALAPADVERQVTYPIETAFAGIPGLESTRSLTRHGFGQVTTVFKDGTDIYFARQQMAERLRAVERNLPPVLLRAWSDRDRAWRRLHVDGGVRLQAGPESRYVGRLAGGRKLYHPGTGSAARRC